MYIHIYIYIYIEREREIYRERERDHGDATAAKRAARKWFGFAAQTVFACDPCYVRSRFNRFAPLPSLPESGGWTAKVQRRLSFGVGGSRAREPPLSQRPRGICCTTI